MRTLSEDDQSRLINAVTVPTVLEKRPPGAAADAESRKSAEGLAAGQMVVWKNRRTSRQEQAGPRHGLFPIPVSYTHLTLPTKIGV